ncbi:TPA: methylenetetrahydrofolate reductase C-terminal domain-containing protein [Pseudomonas aeruginosa]|uniref:methylenetetrahydrofolate reductase C-terminal domain-containing protein n=1 Tax=Pseudomonas TaxID=286 RepID=UPI00093C85ED|nr:MULTISPECIES: methylenetetrahydrofolate reductase C-terminal domain-containing protein [Pseudomonas]EKX2957003.1 methylenetetrahydrofolate reductase C-terminal domain-containing protein [Pseudomonas aeruginosa]MBG4113917.1 methylenetetrahydrofolate reductase C-terminal domain-containing protein [Pseudomonas aeruginosa]MBI6936953.1 methylenetetrahydrofolate reductase C-terminal domain-containing protein [Pseudomonas aeruginosa]MBI8014260.1 methylenetetrahydrofolate reductase C-terminal domain
MNTLKKALDEQSFVCVIEFVPKPSRFTSFDQLMQRKHLCGWPVIAAVADRVGSNSDLAPLDAIAQLALHTPALLHFSGKDREREDLLSQLERMDAAGLNELLVLSGDRLLGHEPGPGQRPVRYLESVPALQIVRQARPNWLLGAALNPFKYFEEEGGAQYFKAEKKLAAGADFLTLQLGFDARKHREALLWMSQQVAPKPLLACVMGLTHRRALILEHVAGVVVTSAMREVLAAEEAASKSSAQSRSVSRLALQILGLQLMGYAGIHLSGIHDVEQLQVLEQAILDWQSEIQTLEQWYSAWEASWQMPGLPKVTFNPPGADWQYGESHVNASFREKVRYHLLAGLHSQLFSRTTWLSQAFGWAMRRPLWLTPAGGSLLHRLERDLKRPLVGCETCGSCRLEDTLYICPETCPKGLANGPCGGTRLNRCEFGDRECVHSIKYRTAKSVQQTFVLTDRLIPCVDASSRQRSSWPQWFEATSTAQNRQLHQAGLTSESD